MKCRRAPILSATRNQSPSVYMQHISNKSSRETMKDAMLMTPLYCAVFGFMAASAGTSVNDAAIISEASTMKNQSSLWSDARLPIAHAIRAVPYIIYCAILYLRVRRRYFSARISDALCFVSSLPLKSSCSLISNTLQRFCKRVISG